MSTPPVVPLLAELAPTMWLLTGTEEEPGPGQGSAPPWAGTLTGQTGSVPLSLCLQQHPLPCSAWMSLFLENPRGLTATPCHGLAEHKQGLDTGAGFLEKARTWLIWLCFLHALPPEWIWVSCMSCQAQDVHLEHFSLPAKLCLFSLSVSGSTSPLCHSNAISYINHPPLKNDNPAYLQISLFIEISTGENTWH